MALETQPPFLKFSRGLAALLLIASAAAAADDSVRVSYDPERWTGNFSVFNLAVADQFGTVTSSLATSVD